MYKLVTICAILMGMAAISSCGGAKTSRNVELKDAQDSISYAIGMSIGQNFKDQKLNEIDADVLAAAIGAILSEDTTRYQMHPDSLYNFISKYMEDKQKKIAEEEKAEGEKFLADNAKKEGVTSLPNGLQYKVINTGTGASPVEGDVVSVYFKGTFIDGEEFQSTPPGQPATFMLEEVIAGWREILKLMKVGDKWTVYVPASMAYGETGNRDVIPPHATLIFDMELLEVVKP